MKLSSLTPQDKIKLAAELDGWTIDSGSMLYDGAVLPWTIYTNKEGVRFNPTDDKFKYATSYDAIIPLIQKLTSQVQQRLWEALELEDDFYPYQKTPTQLLDALLVATGKAEL
jgi:hypothetical protein